MSRVVLGLDFGGTATGATAIDADTGAVLLDDSVEVPSLASEGPDRSMGQIQIAYNQALAAIGADESEVVAAGLITPGPSASDSTIIAAGSPNLRHPGWPGFNSRNALSALIGKPVFFTNDGNAAALWAYYRMYGDSIDHILEALIVGTGLGGGKVERGVLCTGFDGRAAEYGHIHIPSHKLLEPGQPLPRCGCGEQGDAESWTTLTAIRENLLPWFLRNETTHPLLKIADPAKRAYQVRALAEQGDELCRRIFALQAKALALTFVQLSRVSDADTYAIGGGICTTSDEFRGWYLGEVRKHFVLPAEQMAYSKLVMIEDGDEAGGRGAALFARAQAKASGLIA